MEEKPGTFTDLFGYLATPAAPETLAVEYIAREFRTERPIGEIFEDEYLTERFTPEQLEALLDRWDLVGLIGEEAVEQYRNPEPELEEGGEDEVEGDESEAEEGEGDEGGEDSEAEPEAEGEPGEAEAAADESPDAWAAEWAGVELPQAEGAEESEESEDADSDDSDSEKPLRASDS